MLRSRRWRQTGVIVYHLNDYCFRSWFQIYNSRSSSIRSKATSPSCSPSSLRVKIIEWTWKNLWSTVWCLRHQPWKTSSWTKPLFCITFWKTQPQKICHTPSMPCPPRMARHCSLPLPIFPRPVVRYAYKLLIRGWLRSISCSRLTVTIQSLSKPRRGWCAGVQRRLFGLDHRKGKDTTLRCFVQMTTTRSSSATSCREYGVLNRQLEGWR